MSKKTVEALEVTEIKTYQCSDGSVYDTKEAALSHEQFLKDCNDNPLIASKIKELESRILQLEAENTTLSARITALEAKNSYPWSKPHPDISPWSPYQQPFNPTTPSPKLPSEPGDVMYFSDKKQYSDKRIDLSKLSDEELIKKGYNVTYCGDKRCVLPPFENPLDKKVEINIDSVRGNATTPPDATPLEACTHEPYMGPTPYEGYISSGSVSIGKVIPDNLTVDPTDKDFVEWWKKNKKEVQ